MSDNGCRCLCSPCQHALHCAGETCRVTPITDDICDWCGRDIDRCLGDMCDDRKDWYRREVGETA